MMNKYAVFGNPIEHSLSPVIHENFAKSLQIQLTYTAILGSIGKFESEAKNFLANGGEGFNVTLPFKQDAFKFSDIKSDISNITKSVNTITYKDGIIYGDNTDGIGFIKDFTQNLGQNIKNKKILLVGAGGAAMGVIPNILMELPKELKIYNRTELKAQNLTNQFKALGPIDILDQNNINKVNFDLIINATSIGINNLKFSLPSNTFNKNTICYDMSYGNASRSFMIWAEYNNLKFYDGLGMLIEQAAESFFIWQNKKPNITQELKNLLRKKL